MRLQSFTSRPVKQMFAALAVCASLVSFSATTAHAQATVYGTVITGSWCELHPSDAEINCPMWVRRLPLEAEIELSRMVKQGKKKRKQTFVIRSSENGEFSQRGIPAGVYSAAVRSLKLDLGDRELPPASDYALLPSQVTVPVQKKGARRKVQVDFYVRHKSRVVTQ